MIRTNLATRPFYNERAVHLAILLLALIVVLASVFNVTRIIQLSRSDTRLGTQASRDEARAAELRASAVRLRASVDPKQIEVVSIEARKANDLIDRRTFSWTELFNRLETTLPDEVRITAVRPKVDSSGTTLTIAVIARAVDDVSQFMDNLQKTGEFRAVVSGKSHADQELATFYDKVLPTDFAAAQRMTYAWVPALARKANVRYEARHQEIDAAKESGKNVRFGRLKTRVVLQCDYENFRQFVYELETSPQFVIIDDISIAQTEANRALSLTLE